MTEPLLTSLQNPRVKQLVKLLERRERARTGLTRIDGARELLRAMTAGVQLQCVYVCEELVRTAEAREAIDVARSSGSPLQAVDTKVYEKIRYGDRDEGLCAVIAWEPLGLDALAVPAPAFVLVIEGVEKPGNLGALLRTADGAGVGAVILADPVCEPANPNVIRASMGTLFTQPVAVATAEAARAWLRARSITPVITRPQAAATLWSVDLRRPVALVMGAEHAGLSDGWDGPDACAVSLPMAGVSDSLNLAAATAVLLYEVVRQRP